MPQAHVVDCVNFMPERVVRNADLAHEPPATTQGSPSGVSPRPPAVGAPPGAAAWSAWEQARGGGQFPAYAQALEALDKQPPWAAWEAMRAEMQTPRTAPVTPSGGRSFGAEQPPWAAWEAIRDTPRAPAVAPRPNGANGGHSPAAPPVTGAQAIEANAFFRGIRERRFASPDYTSGELGALAAKKVLERNGVHATSIDLIITACVLTDLLANGIGADVQKRIGAHNANFLNVDTNCTSWIAALNVARAFVESGLYRRVLVITVTNFVSRLQAFQKFKGSWALGDGASATLVVRNKEKKGSILAIRERSHGDLYGKMRLEPEQSPDGCYRQYWENSKEPLTVNFSQDLLDKIREHATHALPEAVYAVLKQADLSISDVGMLLTHQPNRMFIDGWREALDIRPPRAHDTLEIYGNLFMGSIPVTLADALDRGLIERGDIITAATFANAGDHVSSIALRW